MGCPSHNPRPPAPLPPEPAVASLAESAPEQSLAWFETQSLWGCPLVHGVPHPGPTLPAGISGMQSASSNATCSPTNSPPPGSYPICPSAHSTAGPPPPNASPASENPCRPRSTPLPDRASAWPGAPAAALAPASPGRSTARRPPSDATTGAYAQHCPEPTVLPSARRSCALRAITVPCSSSATVCADRHAPRLWPGPQYMPRSASAVGLAKRGVIPRKQFYIKLFFYNTVILVDTRAGGNLLSAPQGLNHFLNVARQAAAEV